MSVERQIASLNDRADSIPDPRTREDVGFRVLDIAAKHENARQCKDKKLMREVIHIDIPVVRKKINTLLSKKQ